MFESSWIAHTLGLHTESLRSFGGITTDTRKISEGDFFVAIKGDTFDGGDFLEDAVRKGAKGVLCAPTAKNFSVLKSGYPDVDFFEVDSTLSAIRKLAGSWRKKFNIPVIVVAGSVGKTTTKEMLAAILCGKFACILKTKGSQNGMLGIPITLLDLRPTHEIAVIEVGIDACDTMTSHMDIVDAGYGLLTAIGPEHLNGLYDIDTVATEEAKALLWFGAHGGVALVRTDDGYIAPIAARLKGSRASVVEYRATIGEISQFRIACPLPGRHNEANFVSAVKMAIAVGLTVDEMTKGIATFKAAYGRTEIRNTRLGGHECVVLCDYYNANPSSMRAAMELLKDMAEKDGCQDRIACLGDMLELGAHEEKYHRELCDVLSGCGFSKIFLYGSRMKWLQDEFKKRQQFVVHFDSHEAMAAALSENIEKRSFILIKGSRGMQMEKVINF